MPNHCENDLVLAGATADVDAVIAHFCAEDGRTPDYNTVMPYPETFAAQDRIAREWKEPTPAFPNRPKDGFNSGGYEWRCANWGTKWNGYAASDLVDMAKTAGQRRVRLSWNSAWGPPIPVICALAEQFPAVHMTLSYYEQGMGFSGREVFAGGGRVMQSYNNKYRGGRGG